MELLSTDHKPLDIIKRRYNELTIQRFYLEDKLSQECHRIGRDHLQCAALKKDLESVKQQQLEMDELRTSLVPGRHVIQQPNLSAA